MQQALRYAEMLDLPFAFSSNGDAFLFGTNTHWRCHHGQYHYSNGYVGQNPHTIWFEDTAKKFPV